MLFAAATMPLATPSENQDAYSIATRQLEGSGSTRQHHRTPEIPRPTSLMALVSSCAASRIESVYAYSIDCRPTYEASGTRQHRPNCQTPASLTPLASSCAHGNALSHVSKKACSTALRLHTMVAASYTTETNQPTAGRATRTTKAAVRDGALLSLKPT